MKLELGIIPINDIQFGAESKVENGTIYVNADELKALILEDENLKSVELDIARPGESVRIMPVKDVIEPRVKVSGEGAMFPGMISKVAPVGSGRTNVLRGSAVVTTGKIVGFQEGIIDMTGEGSKYTPFSKLNNLVVVCEPIDGLAKHAHEKAVRMAGLKTADYIGKLAKDIVAEEVETFETVSVKEGIEKWPELPRVGYVLMLQSQGLMHDTYVYGVDAKQSLSKQVKDSFQKFGFVKYNAFKGMGGNLSFVIAMLDGNNTGFVLDVVHSREGCYIYLKEVEEGATEVLLGSEEQEALEQALGYVKRPSISDGDGKRGRREKTEDVYSGSGEQSIEISGSERNKSERMKKLRRQQREAIGADMDEIMDMEDMDGVEPERNEGEY